VTVSGPAGSYTLSVTDSGGDPHMSWTSSGSKCG